MRIRSREFDPPSKDHNRSPLDAIHPQPYRIALPEFEGPFDLLLFFIERDEIDIQNIPIARITDDFLGYIREAKALDISLAGEFVVVAATLVSIKTKVLLPRVEVDAAGEEVDPRRELVDRLLEYKRYRSVLDELRYLERERGERFGRPFVAVQFAALVEEARGEAEWESVSLYRLLKTFERVLQRQADRVARPVHRVMRWPYTVEAERARLTAAIRLGGRLPFTALFGACRDRVQAVVTLLALLELLNIGAIALQASSAEHNDFVVANRKLASEI